MIAAELGSLAAGERIKVRQRLPCRLPTVPLPRPGDVLLAMSGIVQSTGQYGTREQAARLIDLLIDALTNGEAPTTC